MNESRRAGVIAWWRGLGRPGRERYAVLIYLVFFAVGTIGHYIEATRGLMLTLTPVILLLFGLSSLLPYLSRRGVPVLIWALGTYLVTFALEAVGVATGEVFGSYTYGPTLGLSLFEVPLIIGFNWVIVVLGAMLAVGGLGDALQGLSGARRSATRPDDTRRSARGIEAIVRVVGSSIAVGLLAVVFDLALEPVAIRFDYWWWSGGSVPLKNYVAWFLIATVVSIPWFASRNGVKTRLPLYYVTVQFFFVVSLLPIAQR